MPEIKNTFTQGKMNQDLDERIVPNGQYIDAMNVKVTSSDDASVGVVQNILGNYRVESIIPPDGGYVCIATIADEKTNKLYWFVTQESSATHAILEYDLLNQTPKIVLVDKKNDTLKFTQNIITGINIIDNLIFWTDNYNEPKKINIDNCIKGTEESNPTVTNLNNALHTRLIVEGEDIGDMSEKNITVIKKSPKQSPLIKTNKPTNKNTPRLFEQVFPRFSFRYKYSDGEYSSFGPFTQVVFNPVYVADEYDRKDAYSTKDSHNLAMTNYIESIEISNFISSSTPKDVTQIEILYKEDGSSVVFSIKTIYYNDEVWINNTYTLKSEAIFAAIPSNQFLRPWDNVPTKALAQEITGNRIVYGNYTQGYDFLSSESFRISNKINAGFGLRENSLTFDEGGLPSLKTQRNYQVGFVWGDKYGRETPVFTSEDGGVNIPWYNNDFELLASKSLFLKANLVTFIPNWADYYKIYVKETSGDYYNLLMEKAYPQSHMNVFDFEEDRVWLAFPSADRNKVVEEDYLIIKKQLIGDHKQIAIENKFKILDIQNEAPDAIRFEYTSLGKATQTSDGGSGGFLDVTTGLFSSAEFRIDQTTDMIHVDKNKWLNTLGGASLLLEDNLYISNLYIYWRTGGDESERYKVVGILFENNTYKLKLQKPIEIYDAEMADSTNASNSTTTVLETDLEFIIDRKDKKDLDEFSGKFFVQIVYKIPAMPESFDSNLPTRITGQLRSNWLYDPISGDSEDANGIINVGSDSSPAENETSEVNTSNIGPTTTSVQWELLAASIDANTNRGFFIDNMYMVAGQPFNDVSQSTSVKISGKTWIGWFEGPADTMPTWGEFDDGSYGWKDGDFDLALPTSYSPRPFSKFGSNRILDVTKAMNGLEGFLTTEGGHIANTIGNIAPIDGYRRWKSSGSVQLPLTGLGDNTYGVSESAPNGIHGVQPNETGRHFIHLSFLAPGVDLHDGNWESNPFNSVQLFGVNSPGSHMQAIWGGGIFTGSGEILEMEGNYDEFDNPLAGTPGPGVGQGYDDRFDYSEMNRRQWDPSYGGTDEQNKEIANFIENITIGNTFRFSSNQDKVFKIIGTPKIKRIYNHTPWIAQYKWDGSTQNPTVNSGLTLCQNSVDEAASAWLDDTSDATKFEFSNADSLQKRITEFGKASNRRVVYIFEVDENPVDTVNLVRGTVDYDSNSQLDITFVSNSPNALLKDLIKGTAIWETEAKPGENLDLYYEASQAIPLYLTNETNELFAPIGSKVEILLNDAKNGQFNIDGDVFLESWNNAEITVTGGGDGSDFGFNVKNAADPAEDIDYAGAQIRFFRPDGSYTTTRLTGIPQPQTGDFVAIFNLDPTLDPSMEVGLSYFNCYSFGNGIESNRVRDDFNAPSISKGVKASLVLDQEYKEENRKNGLIYSGIYNSTSGVNNLNQFIMAENITKDLNPTYGSIQKLFQRRISLVAFCEDRVVSITSNKDALFNADGNSQLVSTNNVLGDATPFVGDFGISKNPESFAKESYRAYFADKQRGAVLRLSMDGITAISDSGMDDYFRDNLKIAGQIIGSYDSHSKNYNITLQGANPGENIISNNFISIGVGSEDAQAPVEIIIDGDITNYNDIVSPTIDPSTNIYNNDAINIATTITNYDAIGIGDLISEVTSTTTTTVSNTDFTTDPTNPSFYYGSYTDDQKPNPFDPGQNDFKIKSYSASPGNFPANRDSFQYPTHDDNNPSTNPTGQESTSTYFYDHPSNIIPSTDVFWNPESNSYNGLYMGNPPGTGTPWFHENSSSGVGEGIVFDGTSATNIITSLVIPGDPTYVSPNHVPAQVQTQYIDAEDNTIFNGEEVKIRFYFRNANYFSIFGNTSPYIRRINIQLYDGTTALGNSVLLDTDSITGNVGSMTDTNYSTYHIIPTSSPYRVGYTTSASFNFANIAHDNNELHEIYFKFTDGTENEGIVVQDLQVHISVVHGDTNPQQTGITAGSISSLNIRKVFELTSAFEQTTTTTIDNPPVPDVEIPAFATVAHVFQGGWNLKNDNTNVIYSDATTFTSRAVTAYGSEFSDLTTYTLDQLDSSGQATGVTATYVFPTDGTLSNGDTGYNDQTDGTYITDDKLFINQEFGGVRVRQFSLSVAQGDWYMVDLIYNSYTAGSDITILSDGSSNGVVFEIVNTDIYGTNQDVLRAVFQIDSDQNTFNKVLFLIPEDVIIEIEELKLIKINDPMTGGDIADWDFNTQPNSSEHSFDPPSVYGSANGIEFNVDISDSKRYVYQNFTTPPTPTNSGYKLQFEISNYVSGSLDLYTIGVDANGNPEGITIKDVIDADGNYSIDFNFDYNSYDLINDGVAVGQTIPASTPNITSMTNLVIFQSDSINGFIGCVKDISLIDITNYFTGASIDSFNITGFDNQFNEYIDFQETTGNGQIIFTNAPIIGDLSTLANPNSQVQIEQTISQAIQQDNTYRLSFDHDLDSGSSIGVYYFSSIDNKGFKVESIIGTDTYNFLHTMDQDHIADHLKNTLVFFVSSDNTSGTIDNIVLRQEFALLQTETISFSENVRGWVSKKSFIPEQGLSVSSEYFTTNKGRLYEHNKELIVNEIDTNRNTFYGLYEPSTITAVLNESPSSVKIFNTLNYEGSQSKIIAGDPAVLRGGNTYNTLDTYNLTEEKGWSVEYIKTDKQEGSLSEFIEKEGKWFNYIKGLSTDIKTSDLSFQGLGVVKQIFWP